VGELPPLSKIGQGRLVPRRPGSPLNVYDPPSGGQDQPHDNTGGQESSANPRNQMRTKLWDTPPLPEVNSTWPR